MKKTILVTSMIALASCASQNATRVSLSDTAVRSLTEDELPDLGESDLGDLEPAAGGLDEKFCVVVNIEEDEEICKPTQGDI